MTDDGYYGLGPKTVQQNDMVWFLFGAKIPVVLRAIGGGQRVLVGDCYIHGLMDGEAVRNVYSEKLQTGVFEIC